MYIIKQPEFPMKDKSAEKPNKFFVALVCPRPLQDRVNQLKIWVREQYGCRVPMNSPPHLTLIPPFWFDSQNEPLVLSAMDSFRYVPGIPEIRLLKHNGLSWQVIAEKKAG